MRHFVLLVGLLFTGTLAIPQPALAKKDCTELRGKARKNCQQKELKKKRKKAPPFKPSRLSPQLKMLDKKNPLNTYGHYVGVPKATGVKPVDRMVRSVAKVEAAVELGKYTTQLQKRGNTERAFKVAQALAPVMTGLTGEIDKISAAVNEIAADPLSIAKSKPLAIPKVTKLTAQSVAKMPKLSKQIVRLTGDVGKIAADGAKTGANAVGGGKKQKKK